MVKVKGFPGPLYPPDHPNGPSPDSDFVIAVKRTLARIGAWPWTPGDWDDSYSNRFAHGDGWGDPTHAGVEGVQHWGNLSPTGAIGEQTANFLRSVKIGQGMPHAGEMAMDSVCVNLWNAAWEDAQASSGISVRERALDRARNQIGVKESPPESNECVFTDWYGMVGPWCAMFTTWCYDGPGAPGSPSFDKNQERFAYVPYLVSDARNGRYGLSVTSSPKPGDLVCYDWQGSGSSGSSETFDHVGLFEEWLDPGYAFTAIEGNTSVNNNSNGGEVMRRSRNVSAQGTVFVRVAEP